MIYELMLIHWWLEILTDLDEEKKTTILLIKGI